MHKRHYFYIVVNMECNLGFARRMQQEPAMMALIDSDMVTLEARSIHRIENGSGLQVTCLEGVLWLTLEGDNRDIALTAGRSFTIDRDGLTVVYALKPSTITVGVAPAYAREAAPFRSVPQVRAA
jgi:hypothetical protein